MLRSWLVKLIYFLNKLRVCQEHNEEHDGEAQQILCTSGHRGGQLTHGLIEVDELKELRKKRRVSVPTPQFILR